MLVSGAPALGANSDHRQQFTEGPLTTPVHGDLPHPKRDAADDVVDDNSDDDEAVSIEDDGNELTDDGDDEFLDDDDGRHDEEEGARKDKRNKEANLYSEH